MDAAATSDMFKLAIGKHYGEASICRLQAGAAANG
jgi:hypothetical protein